MSSAGPESTEILQEFLKIDNLFYPVGAPADAGISGNFAP
jgi:hypothetical protein